MTVPARVPSALAAQRFRWICCAQGKKALAAEFAMELCSALFFRAEVEKC